MFLLLIFIVLLLFIFISPGNGGRAGVQNCMSAKMAQSGLPVLSHQQFLRGWWVSGTGDNGATSLASLLVFALFSGSRSLTGYVTKNWR